MLDQILNYYYLIIKKILLLTGINIVTITKFIRFKIAYIYNM